MRQFQEEYIGIEVRAANKENLVAVITGTPEPDAELEVLSSVSTAFPDQIGERILSVYEACRDRRL